MLIMQNNPVLVALASRAVQRRVVEVERAALEAEYVDEEVARRVRRIKRTLEQRRYRRWDRMLGRRRDGQPIRPIPSGGGRFRFAPILSSVAIADIRRAVRQEVEGTEPERNCYACYTGTRANEDGERVCPRCLAIAGSVEGHPESWFHSFAEWAKHEAV